MVAYKGSTPVRIGTRTLSFIARRCLARMVFQTPYGLHAIDVLAIKDPSQYCLTLPLPLELNQILLEL